MSEITDFLIKLGLPFFTGGLAGSSLTILYNRHRSKIQIMECHYIDDAVISKLPVAGLEGVIHNNIYSKQFILKNTTNCDQKHFEIIFEFDMTAKIISYTDISKRGYGRLKKKLLKQNEYSAAIKNFNRKDEVVFIFEIANVSEDSFNVTEDNCTGFKIQLKDKRKATKSKMTIVKKGI
jgi:hypothetical protein